MGHAKDRSIQGLSFVKGAVCADCFGDPGLAALVTASASELRCDFCGKKSKSKPIAAPVDDVVDHMNECISREYEDPANSCGWSSEEGGWLAVRVLHTDELLTDELGLEFPNDHDGKLLDALCDGLGGASREWVRRDPYGPAPEDVYEWSWDRFSRLVKHSRRFFFLDHGDRPNDELLSPHELLRRIGHFSKSHGLVRVFPAGTRLYRVRNAKPGETLRTPLELGPPSAARSRLPTRMSPAGIPMFYGADDGETALWETWDEAGLYVTACFEFVRDVLILDLTKVPRVPSLFEPLADSAETDPRYELIFLHQFMREVSEPIDRQGRAHVDYVPTQIVAEYFRAFPLEDGRRIDGIKYASARRPGHSCYALFAGPEQVILSEEDVERYHASEEGFFVSAHAAGWLRLVGSSERVVPCDPSL